MTPPWCVHRLLERLELPRGLWYEPCAGEGAIVQAVGRHHPTVEWWLNELRPETEDVLRRLDPMARITIGDYLDSGLELPPRDQVKVVITNPPYRVAWELLHKTLKEFPNAHVVLLLRVNFIASQTRHGFMNRYMPDVYVLPNRPGFKGWGKTDSPEYGWFYWRPIPRARTTGKLQLLELTSKEERKQDAAVMG